VHNSVLNRA